MDKLRLLVVQEAEETRQHLASSRGDEFLVKAKLSYEKALEFLDQGDFVQATTHWLKGRLDATYSVEQVLIANEFSDFARTRSLLRKLSEGLDVYLEHAPPDVDIQECIEWRQGALAYMYCSTVRQNEERYEEMLRFGIDHLKKMLDVRQPIRGSVECKDSDTKELLEYGAFSDTHVLGLMYLGEMCDWLRNFKLEDEENRQITDLEQTVLKTYVKLTEGPLKSHGWSSANARSLLSKLE